MLQLEKLMCTPITIGIESTIADVVKIMLENKINGVGVLSNKGNLIGILSKTNIIKAITSLN